MLVIGALVWLFLPETAAGAGGTARGDAADATDEGRAPATPVDRARRRVGPGESICGPTAECGYCAGDD
jgi:hypothetical protein